MIASEVQDAPTLPLARREDLIVHHFDGESVVYDVAHDAVHYLNRTSLFIWERCDGRHKVEQIIDELADAHRGIESNNSPGIFESDVRQTIGLFARNGLLRHSR